MLHELLLALYGISGGIFIESKEKGDNDDNDGAELDEGNLIPLVNDNLLLLPESEFSLQKELLKLGSCYNYLKKFIEKFSQPNYGLYLSAFAFGIDDSLNKYREDLCSIEAELSADISIGVSYLSCRLHTYKILLPVLVKVTKKVESVVINPEIKHTYTSCRLLDIILSATPPGLPGPRHIIRKVVSRVMQVFYRQISSWIIYGILYDPYTEFFIKKTIESNHDKEYPEYSDQKKSLFIIDHNYIPSFLPTSFAQRVYETGQAVYSASHDPSEASFIMELEKTYIPRFTKISSLCFLQKEDGDNDDEAESSENSLSNLVNVNEVDSLVCDIKSIVSHHVWCSVMQEYKFLDYLRLFKDVLLLGRGELFLAFLDQLNFKSSFSNNNNSSSPRSSIDWEFGDNLLIDQTPPPVNEVEALEYDITQAFLAAARCCLDMDDEELDSKFKFFIKLKTPTQHDQTTSTTTATPTPTSIATPNTTTDLTVLDCLYLHINIPSALDCLFSTQICHAYNRLFHFLFYIRRTQLKLQQYWADQILLWRRARFDHQLSSTYDKKKEEVKKKEKKNDNITMSNSDCINLQLKIGRRLLVRNHMAFIIENLLYYLQVDVIESQFSHLLYRCETDQEIQLIQIAHEAYLASLQAQALLFMPNIKSCILNLLNTCCQFVQISSQLTYDSNDSRVDADAISLDSSIQLSNREQHIINTFYDQSKLLYEVISMSCSIGAKSSVSINSTAYTHHRVSRGNNNTNINTTNHPILLNSGRTDLNQLLLRLDFNNYYSNLPEDLI